MTTPDLHSSEEAFEIVLQTLDFLHGKPTTFAGMPGAVDTKRARDALASLRSSLATAIEERDAALQQMESYANTEACRMVQPWQEETRAAIERADRAEAALRRVKLLSENHVQTPDWVRNAVGEVARQALSPNPDTGESER